jgi:hypothetical protein
MSLNLTSCLSQGIFLLFRVISEGTQARPQRTDCRIILSRGERSRPKHHESGAKLPCKRECSFVGSTGLFTLISEISAYCL